MTRKHKLTAHDAEPLYVTIPLEEYKKLKEVEKLYKNIMKIDKILRETDYLMEQCTLSNLDHQSIKEKCRNLSNFGISWMMQGSNLRPAD